MNYTELTNLKVRNDLDVKGVAKVVKLGEVEYTATSGSSVTIYKLPAGYRLSRVICEIEAAFNSGTSDVLILGTADNYDALMASGDITEGTIGAYFKNAWLSGGSGGVDIKAKLTKTGTAATAGKAVFYAEIFKL